VHANVLRQDHRYGTNDGTLAIMHSPALASFALAVLPFPVVSVGVTEAVKVA
jgi:hypothetical protein